MHRLSSLFVAVPLLMAGCSKSPADSAAKPAAPATVEHARTELELATVTLSADAVKRLGVQSTPAAVEQIARSRTLGGEVVVPDGKTVIVSAPLAGTLVSAGGATAGARVRKGEAIFRLLPLSAAERDQRIDAERAVSAAEAEEQAARQRRDRLNQLLKEGAASARSLEEATAQYGVDAAALTAARERLRSLSRNPVGPQGEITISAPIDGVLQSVAAAQGQTVAAAAPLFEIAQVDALWVRVPVYAGSLNQVDTAATATLSLLEASAAPRTLRRVTAPLKADAAAVSVDLVYAIVGPATGLRPGQRVSVELPLVAAAKGLVIPDAAVLYDMHGATWVYEDQGQGRYVRRRVEVAGNVGGKALLSRGVAEGTKVVTAGAAEIFGTEFAAGK